MFKIGQKVSFLYEKGDGIIINLEPNRALVSDDSGFDRWFPINELVFIHSEKYADDEISISKEDLEPEATFRVIEERTGVRKPRTIWEIDLHIEEILESTQGMSNTEILMKQMAEFRATFKKAKNQSIHKLVVIHGVGEGVLKNEIRTYLAQQDQIEVYDADFLEYGKEQLLSSSTRIGKMNSELIDEDLNRLNPKRENQPVRILSGVLSLLILPLSAFCYTDIIQFIENYAIVRGKYLFGTESLHGMISSFFISSIPVIAYNCWIKRKSGKKNGIPLYLILLFLTVILFALFFIAQMELILEFSRPVKQNFLMPSYIVIPPFSFCFDLFFIVAALLSFLSLRGLIYISNKRSLLSRK